MEKKSGLAFQKVAKTSMVILEKKGPVVGGIDYVRYLSMQKVKQLQANATNTWAKNHCHMMPWS